MAMKLRQVVCSALLLGSVVLGSACSEDDPPTPADTVETTVWDDFKGGFSAGSATAKWFHLAAGPYTTNDGNTTILSNGLRVVAKGTNPETNRPAFSLTLDQEKDNGGVPSTFDHVKFLAYMNSMSTAGFPGFDTVEGKEFACVARMTGQTFGTRAHPFGVRVDNANADLRLASFAMANIDVESYMVFDFFITNRRIYAFYERLPFGRTATNNYASFSYAIPVKNRTRDQVHDLSIAYDRTAGTVRWIVDGKELYRVTQVGRRLPASDNKYLMLDLGGVEQDIKLNQLDCGMATFSLLDGSVGSQPGLVRLSSDLVYYSPTTGAPNLQTFVDETSQDSSRLFGQGAEFRVGEYKVTNTVHGAPVPAFTYVDPGPIAPDTTDSSDGTPQTGPLP
ncbi:DUF6081 family protein [Hyalangium sp.]|uniref:DUF6081 family protein n=1 Tax=Hyalangium sp. TaxID=2028555 RepID=UPI002D3B97D8|nr:DUF6081 family protein [Hyalangium sp.]HYH95012.1 DUF6081 family protein [Hyalangium sp.]